MAQRQVVGYQLQLSLSPPRAQGGPLVPFVPRVFVQFQANGQFTQINLQSNEEFLALCGLLSAPGRLLFDDQQATFEKTNP